ncbi:hypothetical protein TrVE_jg3317 [Triparma verrucosa]|uniref:Uncharacterized protein n=1 Tax=Triparma verrucosa TaxID=1606542 RepID=A0A9W7FF95_9STRA|nr:hypothetical protein TrVE_jg3317 [Triparma verrucosa]
MTTATTIVPPPPPLCSSLESPTPTCLGVIDGLLADCTTKSSCTSSQDDRPGVFSPPWQIEGYAGDPMDKLLVAVEQRKDFKKVLTYDRDLQYLRVEFNDFPAGVSDVEFLKTKNDDTIQFRAESRTLSPTKEKKRIDELRLSLGYTEIPVLRNRRRALIVVESEFDTFGPSSTRDPTIEEERGGYNYRDMDPMTKNWAEGERYDSGQRMKSEFQRFLQSESDDRTRNPTIIKAK